MSPRMSDHDESGLFSYTQILHLLKIEFARARRIDYAYVIFDHEYFAALDVIRPFLEASRIISSGRYGEWNYSAMEDAILFGKAAAERAIEIQQNPA